MNNQTIKINQGDSTIIEETITGASSLTGYVAKLYIKDSTGTLIDTITGDIVDLLITYELLNEDTKVYPVGNHSFETKVFDTSDHVCTPSKGDFIVDPVIENDPSV